MKKQFIQFLFFCICLLGVSQVWGQGTIKGSVKDSVENEILYGATVSLKNDAGEIVASTSSDYIDGVFSLEAPAGAYILESAYMGYATYTKKIAVKNGETIEITINLAEEVNVLKTVTKTATRFETPVGKTPISLDVVKPSLVDNTNATKVDEVVDKVPGVTVVDGQANIRGGSGYSYGAGSRVLLLVDDLPLLSGDAGRPSWRDIPVENISQIEVVKGAASALYGSSALNGIINIRTAYAKNKPYTKVSLFGTGFVTPNRANTAWWNYDEIEHWNAENNDSTDLDTITPALLSGPRGYRKPIELGVQAAHRRKIGKFDLTLGANYFYKDSHLAGEYMRLFRINSNMRYRFSTKINAGININVNTANTSSFFLWGNQMPYVSGFQGTKIDTAVLIPLAGSITETERLLFNIDPYFTAYDNKEGRHRLQTRYYYANFNNSNNQSNTSQMFYGEYQYQKKFDIESNFFGDFKLVAGGVGTYTYSSSQLYGNASYDIFSGALYIQAEQGLFKEKDSENCKLNISFGVRWEVFNIESPKFIRVDPHPDSGLVKNEQPSSLAATGVPRPRFRLGLNYEITPITFLRASWGEGYRYPTIAERYITTLVGSGTASLAIKANPTLQPEEGWSAEIGIKQGFKIGKWKGFADLSGFWTEYQNMMEFSFGGGNPSATGLPPNGSLFFQSVNIDDTRIAGFEFSLMGTGKLGPVTMNVMAGYTFISPQFKNWDDSIKGPRIQALSSADYNVLKYRSVHTAKFDIEAFFLDDALSLGFSLNYNSRMNNIDKAFEDILDDGTIGLTYQDDIFGIGYYRQNFNSGEAVNIGARIGYKYKIMNKDNKEMLSLKLSLVGKNLLNQEYMIRPALVAAPANFTVRLDVEF